MRQTAVYIDESIEIDEEAKEVLEKAGYSLTETVGNGNYVLLVMPTATEVRGLSAGDYHVIALEIFGPGTESRRPGSRPESRERMRVWFKAGASDVRDCPGFAGSALGEQLLDILINT